MKEQQGTPDYLQAFESLTRDIIQYGYKWGNPSPSAEPPPYKSLEDYVAHSERLLEVLGKWWGCSTPNLYFYDRTREEAQGQLRWFHEAVEGGIDVPWLSIRRRQQGDQTFECDHVSQQRKSELREQQRSLRVQGRLAANILFRMFAEGRYKRSASEEANGWILVPSGEILAYSFEWRLRQAAEALNNKQPGTDLVNYFTKINPTIVENTWEHLVQKLGKPGSEERYFHEKMLDWLDKVIADEREFSAWWREWPDGNYDWFIAYARAEDGRQPLRTRLASMPFPNALHELVRIIIKHWDYQHAEGKDQNWETFLQRLRFSPEMEVEHFGTRNLLSLPLWLHWLRNGKETEDPQRTHAAFLMAGFYDADVARRYARNIQCIFLLLAQPYVARHALPVMMLAKTGLLAESASYMYAQEISLIRTCVRLLTQRLTSMPSDEAVSSMRATAEAISHALDRSARITDDLYWLSNREALISCARTREVVHLRDLILGVCQSLSLFDPSAGLKLVVTGAEPDAPAVLGDETTLRHAFMELMLNAVHAIEDQDSSVTEGVLTVAVRRDGQRVVVNISDTGVGMDAETQARLFEPFFSTKRRDEYRGSGLGLWHARTIIRGHGGDIALKRSAPGEGTEFEITLPLSGSAHSERDLQPG